MARWSRETAPELPERFHGNMGSAQQPGKGDDPLGLPLPISWRRIGPRLWTAVTIEYLFLTLSIAVSQLRLLPPVSQRWAKPHSEGQRPRYFFDAEAAGSDDSDTGHSALGKHRRQTEASQLELRPPGDSALANCHAIRCGGPGGRPGSRVDHLSFVSGIVL